MNKKIEWLNDLRGIAVLSVLISHLFIMFICGNETVSTITHTINYSTNVSLPKFLLLFPFGPFGVTLFFLLSGYVIAVSLKHKNIFQFFSGRFFRIYPLYWISFSLCIAMIYINSKFYNTQFGISLHETVIHYIVGIRDLYSSPQIDYIIWTLEIEVKFYLFMSLFYTLIKKQRNISLIVIATSSIFLTNFSVSKANIALPTDLSMQFAYINLMLIGTYCYLYHDLSISKLFISIVALFSAFTYMFFKNLWFLSMPINVYFGYLIGLILFLSFNFIRPKRNKILSWFADISYPLYLFHPILGYSIEYYLYAYLKINIFISISIAIALVISLAYIVHALVELPLMRFSKKITI